MAVKLLTPDLHPAIATAIGKVELPKKIADASRDALAAGTAYSVDLLVRATGTLNIGPDETKTHWAAVPWEAMLAVALSKLNGVTVAALLREVAANGHPDAERIKAEAAAAAKDIIGGTVKTFRGKVTCDLRLSVEQGTVASV